MERLISGTLRVMEDASRLQITRSSIITHKDFSTRLCIDKLELFDEDTLLVISYDKDGEQQHHKYNPLTDELEELYPRRKPPRQGPIIPVIINQHMYIHI
ncbi:hypothetical protein HDV02_002474, partial [Globomyces sp. JEL0801]